MFSKSKMGRKPTTGIKLPSIGEECNSNQERFSDFPEFNDWAGAASRERGGNPFVHAALGRIPT
jgi:hypothetical protein